jgi:hypothetical protein
MVLVLVDVEGVEEDKEVVAELLKAMAESTSVSSPELGPPKSVSAILKGDFASSVTRSDTVFSSAGS